MKKPSITDTLIGTLPIIGQALTENSAIIVAMIAGSALMAIALVCWLVSESENTKAVIKGLVLYNFAVVLIVVFSAFQLSVYNLLFSGVAGTHFMYGIWCLLVIKK